MKRIGDWMCRALTVLLVLLALALPAAADETAPESTPVDAASTETTPAEADPFDQAEEKTVTFAADGTISMEPAGQAAFWEYPLLSAGQSRRAGTLRLVNASDKTVNFRLSSFGLPYGNVEALTYLNALHITVSEGDTVLYDGSYSRIADPDGLQIVMENWQPGSERVLTIALRCGFDYTGTFQQATVPMSWSFSAYFNIAGVETTPQSPDLQTPRPVTTVIISSIAGGVAILCAIGGVVGVMIRRRRGKTLRVPDDTDNKTE